VGAAKYRCALNDLTIRHALTSLSPCFFHFNPPSAPHFGGLYAAAERSFKILLTRLVGVHNFSWEEMTTVLCYIELTVVNPDVIISKGRGLLDTGTFLDRSTVAGSSRRVNTRELY